MDYIPRKKGVKHTCKNCTCEFDEYLYWESCQSCNDGEDDEGRSCLSCGGKGEYEEWVKTTCEDCLRESIGIN